MFRFRRHPAGPLAVFLVAALLACGQATDVAGALAEARAHLASGNAAAAQDSLQNALEADPTEPEVHRLLGELHVALGEFPEAIFHLTKALALEPGNVDVLALRAAAYLDSNEPEHTLVDLNRAIRTDPGNLSAYVLRGETRAALGQLDGAVADAEVVVGAADDLALQASALWLRGTVRLNLGDLDGGIADLSRLLELDPQDADAYAARGRAQAAIGRFDAAVGDLRRALEVSPQNPVPLLDLARVLLTQDRLDEARAAIDLAKRQLPDEPGLRLISGDYAARAGDVQLARSELEAAIAMADEGSPIQARARALLAQLTGR